MVFIRERVIGSASYFRKSEIFLKLRVNLCMWLVFHFHRYSHILQRIQNQNRSNAFITDNQWGLATFWVYRAVESAASNLEKSGINWRLKIRLVQRGGNSHGVQADVERRNLRGLTSQCVVIWGHTFNKLLAEYSAGRSCMVNGQCGDMISFKNRVPFRSLLSSLIVQNPGTKDGENWNKSMWKLIHWCW